MSKSWFLSIIAALSLVMLSTISPTPAPAAPSLQPTGVIWRVAPNGSAGPCGAVWGNPCNLEYALGNAHAGDELWVKAGLYKPTLNGSSRSFSFVLVEGVQVYGGFAGGEAARNLRNYEANVTVLSGDIDDNDTVNAQGVVTSTIGLNGANSYHVVGGFLLSEATVLDGFTITAGMADGTSVADGRGGGLYSNSAHLTLRNLIFSGNLAASLGGGFYESHSNPKLTNVTFKGNRSHAGGGMHSDYSIPTLTQTDFSNNTADYGAGMSNSASNPSLIDVTFSRNIASYTGGGMYNYNSSPVLTEVVFTRNQASRGAGMRNKFSHPTLRGVLFEENVAGEDGGGIHNSNGSQASLTNVTFLRNQATSHGGGVFNRKSNPILVNSSFLGNVAASGGGFYNESGDPKLVNALFSGNLASTQGGGMKNMLGRPTLINATFSANLSTTGGAIFNDYGGYPTLDNVILWGNSAISGSPEIQTYENVDIFHSLISGGCPLGSSCSSVLDANPLFVQTPSPGSDGNWGTSDDVYGNLHLRFGSPAVGFGDNLLLPADVTDLDDDGDTTEQLPLDRDMFPRLVQSNVDLGAYETPIPLFLPLLRK